MPNINIEITEKDYVQIASGVFITFGGGETTIRIRYNLDALNFIFSFQDTDDKSTKVDQAFQVINKKTLKIIFINFRKAKTGGHTNTPTLIGTLGKRNLMLVWRLVYLSNSKSYQIIYSFYLSKKPNK